VEPGFLNPLLLSVSLLGYQPPYHNRLQILPSESQNKSLLATPFVGITLCWHHPLLASPFVGIILCWHHPLMVSPFVGITFCWHHPLLASSFDGIIL
jgi:hypothetical protein